MAKIPTSSEATVQLKPEIPANVDAVAVFVHKQTKPGGDAVRAMPEDVRETVDALLAAGSVTGKSNELTTQLLTSGGNGKARRLLVVGLGAREKFCGHCLLEAGGTLAKAARRQKLRSIAAVVPEVPDTMPGVPEGSAAGPGEQVAVENLAAGFLLASFDFEEFKGAASRKKDDAKDPKAPAQLTIVTETTPAARDALARARAVSDGQNFARTIASRPGNDINPPALADVARELARATGLKLRVLDEREMEKLGMGGILAVGAGSRRVAPPRMIVLEHRVGRSEGRGQKSGNGKARASSIGNRKSATGNSPPLLVVGKAITFDTGGISIKPAEKMGRMIFDKCGAMAVLGMMYAVATLDLPIPVVGILSSAENHISETAYRPGDILRMYNGVTVEVTNTDAEGRLVLGDALAWGIETYNPSAVIDLATLTGGVVVALGKTMAGVMGNDDGLIDELNEAADAAGEKMWRLPLGDDQREYIKSDPADIVNSGGREGHPLQGGAFLSYFVKYDGKDRIPWAHLDIAGVADTEKEQPVYTKGATGWGVRTLVNWVESRSAGRDGAKGGGRGVVMKAKADRKVPPPAGG
jgi:leucyl aminopeptidase